MSKSNSVKQPGPPIPAKPRLLRPITNSLESRFSTGNTAGNQRMASLNIVTQRGQNMVFQSALPASGGHKPVMNINNPTQPAAFNNANRDYRSPSTPPPARQTLNSFRNRPPQPQVILGTLRPERVQNGGSLFSTSAPYCAGDEQGRLTSTAARESGKKEAEQSGKDESDEVEDTYFCGPPPPPTRKFNAATIKDSSGGSERERQREVEGGEQELNEIRKKIEKSLAINCGSLARSQQTRAASGAKAAIAIDFADTYNPDGLCPTMAAARSFSNDNDDVLNLNPSNLSTNKSQSEGNGLNEYLSMRLAWSMSTVYQCADESNDYAVTYLKPSKEESEQVHASQSHNQYQSPSLNYTNHRATVSPQLLHRRPAASSSSSSSPSSPIPPPSLQMVTMESGGANLTDEHAILMQNDADWNFADRFKMHEADYIPKLSLVKEMIEVIRKANFLYGGWLADSSLFEFFGKLRKTLENLEQALNGMQNLAMDLKENLSLAINQRSINRSQQGFLHVYTTRGQLLRMYPSAWFAAIDAVAQILQNYKNSSDHRIRDIYTKIKEKTGKEFYELLEFPALHLCGYRSLLENYVDFLEEQAQTQESTIVAAGVEVNETVLATQALEMIVEIIDFEDSSAENEAMARLSELLQDSPLSQTFWQEPRGRLKKHGRLLLAGKSCHVYLFNDTLLLFVFIRDKKSKEKVAWVEEIKHWTVKNHHDNAFELDAGNMKTYVFSATSERECGEWQQTLSSLSQRRLAEAQFRFDKISKDKWIPDADRPKCVSCNKQFTTSNRRHHCRRCGEIFCAKCSSAWIKFPSQKLQSRVCLSCFKEHNEISLLQMERRKSCNSASPITVREVKNIGQREREGDEEATVESFQFQWILKSQAPKLGVKSVGEQQVWQTGQLSIHRGIICIKQGDTVRHAISVNEISAISVLNGAKNTLRLQLLKSEEDSSGIFSTFGRVNHSEIRLRWSKESDFLYWRSQIELQRRK